jgi:hypothetical protein
VAVIVLSALPNWFGTLVLCRSRHFQLDARIARQAAVLYSVIRCRGSVASKLLLQLLRGFAYNRRCDWKWRTASVANEAFTASHNHQSARTVLAKGPSEKMSETAIKVWANSLSRSASRTDGSAMRRKCRPNLPRRYFKRDNQD